MIFSCRLSPILRPCARIEASRRSLEMVPIEKRSGIAPTSGRYNLIQFQLMRGGRGLLVGDRGSKMIVQQGATGESRPYYGCSLLRLAIAICLLFRGQKSAEFNWTKSSPARNASKKLQRGGSGGARKSCSPRPESCFFAPGGRASARRAAGCLVILSNFTNSCPRKKWADG